MAPRTAYQRRDELQLLDVREHAEWAAGRIEGARHIPLAGRRPETLGRGRPAPPTPDGRASRVV